MLQCSCTGSDLWQPLQEFDAVLSCLGVVMCITYLIYTAKRRKSLLTAAKAGDLARVEQLLPSATPLELHNALVFSSRAGHVPVVETLMRHAAPVTIHEALLVASAGPGQQPVVELLLTRATHADATAALLGAAAKGGHLGIVQLLVAAGADVTAESNTAVVLAETMHHEGVVQYLVERGADLAIGRAIHSPSRFWLDFFLGLNNRVRRVRPYYLVVGAVLGAILIPPSVIYFVLRYMRGGAKPEPFPGEVILDIVAYLLFGWVCCAVLLLAIYFFVCVRLVCLRGRQRGAA